MAIRHLIAGVVTAGLVAVLAYRTVQSPSGRVAAVAPPAALAVVSPVAPVAPPVGDARQLAVSWVASTGDLVSMGSIERNQSLETYVVPSVLGPMAASFDSTVADLGDRLPVPTSELLVIETPITATIVETAAGPSDGDVQSEVEVEVWSVVVFGAERLGPPRAVWRTTTVLLQVVDGGWRIRSLADRVGPTPVGGDSLPAGWEQFAAVAGWPAAAGVGVGS